MRSFLLLVLCLTPHALAAQDAFRDPVARQLVERARHSRDRADRSIAAYTAVVRQRDAAVLRLPLKDRLLSREEMAARVHWSRDGETLVHLLASREQDRDEVDASGFSTGAIFDPGADRVYFALGDAIGSGSELWISHPLATDAERHYRYASGDTMTVRLPDGRTIRAVELHVIPRRPSFRYLTAALWIEPESGSLVQAVYRPARNLDLQRDSAFLDEDDLEAMEKVPGFLKPMEVDLETVVVQYSLWGLRHWLPRLMRVEGYARAGVLRFHFTQEIGYEVESVADDAQQAAALRAPLAALAQSDSLMEVQRGRKGRQGDDNGESGEDDGPEERRVRVFRPKDEARLIHSAELPPPIWEDAPAFASDQELEALVEKLDASVPRSMVREPLGLEVQWGMAASDLLRFNRVEGLSVGVRGTARHGGREGRATLRLGVADLHPNLELAARVPGRSRTVELAAYHQLASADGASQALGLGNSLGAILFGRDYGEYYRTTGARLSLTPPAADRPWYRAGLFAERQRGVERGTGWNLARLLDADHAFRPNLDADDAELLGATLTLAPWWGRDPLAPQAGVEYVAEAAIGDFQFARSRLTGRSLLPLGSRHRVGLEAAAGTTWGAAPAQYRWFLGGPETLRGYGGSAAVGPDLLRGRAELARGSASGAFTLFADAGWAGRRADFEPDDALIAVGIGASVLEGLLRLDLARALRGSRGWRLELYLDALL